MKLLIYARDWAPSVGGVQTIVKTLADGLADWSRKHNEEPIEVTLLTQTPAGSMNDSQLPYRVVRNPGLMAFIREIRRADVIHLAGPTLVPLIIGYLLRKPVIVEHHGYQAICPNGLLFKQPSQTVCPGHFAEQRYGKCLRCCSSTEGTRGGLRTLLLTFPRRWLSRKMAANIMISNHLGARLKLPLSKTIYYGIPDARQPSMKDSLPASKAFEVAYVGRLVSEKGLPLLLEAAKRLQGQGIAFKLFFIGGGPEQDRLEQMVRSMGLSDLVTFTGDLRGAELKKMVGEIAVVVMPSLWEETAGLAAMEQMISGGAVIVANIGGLAEIVGEAGLKFAPGNSEELYSCLKILAQDRIKIEELGAIARARALKEFSVERFVTQHASIYRNFSKGGDAHHLNREEGNHASS